MFKKLSVQDFECKDKGRQILELVSIGKDLPDELKDYCYNNEEALIVAMVNYRDHPSTETLKAILIEVNEAKNDLDEILIKDINGKSYAQELLIAIAIYFQDQASNADNLLSKYLRINTLATFSDEIVIKDWQGIITEFTENEVNLLSMTCTPFYVFYLLSNKHMIPSNILRIKFLRLLCLPEWNWTCTFPFDDYMIYEEDDEYSYLTIFKNLFLHLKNKQQIRAAINIVPRWLKQRDRKEEWAKDDWDSSPQLDEINKISLLSYYNEIIRFIVDNEQYSDEKIASSLTKEIASIIPKEQKEYFTELAFFRAYYCTSQQKISYYEELISFGEGGYIQASANNVIYLYLKQRDIEKSTSMLTYIKDEKNLLNLKVAIEECHKKTEQWGKLIPIDKHIKIESLSDFELAELASMCFMYSEKKECYQFDSHHANSYLTPSEITTVKLIEKLANKGYLLALEIDDELYNKNDITRTDISTIPYLPILSSNQSDNLSLIDIIDALDNRKFNKKTRLALINDYKFSFLLNKYIYELERYDISPHRDFTNEEYQDIQNFVGKFSPSQLSAITFNAINFVSGTRKRHGFGNDEAFNRTIKRMTKMMAEYTRTSYSSKTFPRNDRPITGIEKVLERIDGICAHDRYEMA